MLAGACTPPSAWRGGLQADHGAVFMCGFATAMCVRSATLASRSIRRGHPREPGEEASRARHRNRRHAASRQGPAAALGDEHAVTVIDRQIALLDNLPDGSRIERTRADGVAAGCDPGLELRLIDARYRPQRLVDTAHRAFIGRHLLGWSDGPSAGRYRDVQSATAHSVMVRLAVLDAEPFSTPTTEGASA